MLIDFCRNQKTNPGASYSAKTCVPLLFPVDIFGAWTNHNESFIWDIINIIGSSLETEIFLYFNKQEIKRIFLLREIKKIIMALLFKLVIPYGVEIALWILIDNKHN
jgi:hypothetical protein